MKHHALILLFLVTVFGCSPKTDEELKSLFESILSSDLNSNRPVWVIAESDTANNRTMFGMDICSAEFFKRSLLGKNRIIFEDKKAVMTIWDCFSACLNDPKVFMFTEEHFPGAVDLISQSHLDSLQKVVDSKVLGDSVRREAFRMIKNRAI